LIDFVSDNPRRFLDAETNQRIAMGRLMLRQTGTIEKLKVTFKRSGHISNDDWGLILAQINDMQFHISSKKLNDSEVADLLYVARPDGFDRTYFVLDVGGKYASPENNKIVQELVELTFPLAMIDFFLKAFLPAGLSSTSGHDPIMGRYSKELKWDDTLLRELLQTRFEKLVTVCDKRKVVDPYGSIIKESGGSPREVIRYGNALLRYAEEHLKELELLDGKAFAEVKAASSADGTASTLGGKP
jgi:hypothetical protein